MEQHMTPSDVTLIEDAIHNPDEPRHFMTVLPAGDGRSVSIGGTVIAESDDAVVVREVGYSIYEPVLYFPREDITMDLLRVTDRTTYCPLKGDTEYFDVAVDGEVVPDAAWSYVNMRLGDELKQLVAFDSSKAVIS